MANRTVGKILKDYATGLWFLNVAEDGVVQCAYFKTEREANWFRMQVVPWNFKWTPDYSTSTGDLNGYFWFGVDYAKGESWTPVKYDIQESARTTAKKSHFFVIVSPGNHPDATVYPPKTFDTYAEALAWVDSKRYPARQELKKIWDVAGDILRVEAVQKIEAKTTEELWNLQEQKYLTELAQQVLRNSSLIYLYRIERTGIFGSKNTWKVLRQGKVVKYFDSYLDAEGWIRELERNHIPTNPLEPSEQVTGYKQV